MADDDRQRRRLAPIYDALDARNWRAAVKLASKKDNLHNPMATVLRAHALGKLGRREDALDLCREVQAGNPTDAHLLNTLLMVLNHCGATEEAVATYEAAVAAQPDNEQLATGLFQSYARTYRFGALQRLATQMYKRHHKRPYLFWAVAGLVLQHKYDDAAPPMNLMLAERLAVRRLDADLAEGDACSGAELRLLLLVLREQGKPQEALDAFLKYAPASVAAAADSKRDGESRGEPELLVRGSWLQEPERIRLEADLRAALGQWGAARDLRRQLLALDGDDWAAHTGFLEAALAADDTGDGDVAALHAELQAGAAARARGPWLAAVELAKRTGGELAPAVGDYVDRFGDKQCCFADVRPYLGDARMDREALRARLAASPAAAGEGEGRAGLQRHVTALQLLHCLGQRADVNALVAAYQRTLPLNEEATGGQREVQVGDDLLLLAGHVLRDLRAEAPAAAEQARLAAERCALLEFAVERSPYNFQCRLQLLRAYADLNCLLPACDHFNRLEVKQIMLDSLSYVLRDDLLDGGFTREAALICQDVSRVHLQSARDAPEYISLAFSNSNYDQVLDIVDFNLRQMDKSQQRAVARAELANLSIHDARSLTDLTSFLAAFGGEAYPHAIGVRPEQAGELVDNRDFDAEKTWDAQPPARPDAAREAALLRTRIAVPSLLHAAVSADAAAFGVALADWEAADAPLADGLRAIADGAWQATAALLRGESRPELAEAVSAALAAEVSAVNEEFAPLGGGGGGGGGGDEAKADDDGAGDVVAAIVAPDAVRRLARLLLGPLSWLSHAMVVWDAQLPKKKKKKKKGGKKKGRGGAAEAAAGGAGAAGEMGAMHDALRAAIAAANADVQRLLGAVRALRDRADVPAVIAAEGLVTELVRDDEALRARVGGMLRDSQQAMLERFVEAVQDRVALIVAL